MAASLNTYPVLKIKPFKVRKKVFAVSTLFLLIFTSLISPLVQFGILNSRPIERLFNVMAAEPQPDGSQPQTDKEIIITREVCGISGSVEVTFAWKKIEDSTKYNLEISRTTDFEPSSTLTATTSSLEHTVTLEADIRFRIRVVGEGEKGEAKSSLAATYYNTACTQEKETDRLTAYSKALTENTTAVANGAVAGAKIAAAPTIPYGIATPSCSAGIITVTFEWTRSESGWNYELHWTGASNVNVGDQGSYSVDGWAPNQTINWTVRAYLGSDVGPDYSSSFNTGPCSNPTSTPTPTPTSNPTPTPTPTSNPTPTPTRTPTPTPISTTTPPTPTPTITTSAMTCTMTNTTFDLNVGQYPASYQFAATVNNLEQGKLFVGATYGDGTVRFFNQEPNFALSLSGNARINSDFEHGYFNSTSSGGTHTFNFTINLDANHYGPLSPAYTLDAFYIQTVSATTGAQIGQNKQCLSAVSGIGGLRINTYLTPTPTPTPTPPSIGTFSIGYSGISPIENIDRDQNRTFSLVYQDTGGWGGKPVEIYINGSQLSSGNTAALDNGNVYLSFPQKTISPGSSQQSLTFTLTANKFAAAKDYTFYLQGLYLANSLVLPASPLSSSNQLTVRVAAIAPTATPTTAVNTPTPTSGPNTPTPTSTVSNMTCVMNPASGIMNIQSLYGQQAQQTFTLTGNDLDRGELYVGVTYVGGAAKFFKNEVNNTIPLAEDSNYSAYIRSDDTGYYNSPGGGSKVFRFTVILSANHPGGTPVYTLPAIYIQTVDRSSGEAVQVGSNKNCTSSGILINIIEAPTPTPTSTPTPTTGPNTPTPTTMVSTPTPTPTISTTLACSLTIGATNFVRGSAAASLGNIGLTGGVSGTTYYLGLISGVNNKLFATQIGNKIEIGDKDFDPLKIYSQTTTISGTSGQAGIFVDASNTVLSRSHDFQLGLFDQSANLIKKCGNSVSIVISDGGAAPTPLGKVTLQTCTAGYANAVLDWSLWSITIGSTPTKYVWEYNSGISLVGSSGEGYRSGESFSRTAGVTGLTANADIAWKATAYNGVTAIAVSPVFIHHTIYCEQPPVTTPTPTPSLSSCILTPNNQPTVVQGESYDFSLSASGLPAGDAYAKVLFQDGSYKFFAINGNPISLSSSNARLLVTNNSGKVATVNGNAGFNIRFYSDANDAVGGNYTLSGMIVQVNGVDTDCKGVNQLGGMVITISAGISTPTSTPTNTPPTPTQTPTGVPTVTSAPTATPTTVPPTATPTTAPLMACTISPTVLALKTGETLAFNVTLNNLDQGDLYAGAYYQNDPDGHFFSQQSGVLGLSSGARIRSTDANLGLISSAGGGTRQMNFRIEADANSAVGNYTLDQFFVQTVRNGQFVRNTSCVAGGGSLTISVSAGLAPTPTVTPTPQPGTPTNTPTPTTAVSTTPTVTPITGNFTPIITSLNTQCSSISNADIALGWGAVSGVEGYGIELAISAFAPSDFSYYKYPADWSNLAGLYKQTTISDYEFVSNTTYQVRVTAIKSDQSQYPSVVRTIATGDCAKMSADVLGLNGSEANKLVPVQIGGDVVQNAFVAVALYNNGWNRSVQIEVMGSNGAYQPVTVAEPEVQIGTGVFVKAKSSGTLISPFPRNSSSYRGISSQLVYFDAYATDAATVGSYPEFKIRIKDGSTYYRGVSHGTVVSIAKETTYSGTKKSGFEFIKALAGSQKGGGCRGTYCWEVNYEPQRAKIIIGLWGTESTFSTVGTSGCDDYGCHEGSMFSWNQSQFSHYADITGMGGTKGNFEDETKIVNKMYTRSWNEAYGIEVGVSKDTPTSYFGPWNVGDDNFTWGGNWCYHVSNGYAVAYNTGLLNDLGPNCYD